MAARTPQSDVTLAREQLADALGNLQALVLAPELPDVQVFANALIHAATCDAAIALSAVRKHKELLAQTFQTTVELMRQQRTGYLVPIHDQLKAIQTMCAHIRTCFVMNTHAEPDRFPHSVVDLATTSLEVTNVERKQIKERVTLIRFVLMIFPEQVLTELFNVIIRLPKEAGDKPSEPNIQQARRNFIIGETITKCIFHDLFVQACSVWPSPAILGYVTQENLYSVVGKYMQTVVNRGLTSVVIVYLVWEQKVPERYEKLACFAFAWLTNMGTGVLDPSHLLTICERLTTPQILYAVRGHEVYKQFMYSLVFALGSGIVMTSLTPDGGNSPDDIHDKQTIAERVLRLWHICGPNLVDIGDKRITELAIRNITVLQQKITHLSSVRTFSEDTLVMAQSLEYIVRGLMAMKEPWSDIREAFTGTVARAVEWRTRDKAKKEGGGGTLASGRWQCGCWSWYGCRCGLRVPSWSGIWQCLH